MPWGSQDRLRSHIDWLNAFNARWSQSDEPFWDSPEYAREKAELRAAIPADVPARFRARVEEYLDRDEFRRVVGLLETRGRKPFAMVKFHFLGALVFVVLGLGFLAYWGLDLMEARASTSWPTVPGTIMSAEVGSKTSTSSGTNNTRGSGSSSRSSSTVYFPQLTYEYTVEGKAYLGDRYWYRHGTSKPHANELLEGLQPGTVIDVRHDPSAPGTSVIEPGASVRLYIGSFAGVGFVIGGLVMLGLGVRVWLG